MPGRDRNLLRIDDMLAAIDVVETVLRETGGTVRQSDRVRVFAIERAFEIVSEASRRLDDDLRASEPGIPWSDIAGIGNILRHDYDDVNFALLMGTATDDLPLLRSALLRMRKCCED